MRQRSIATLGKFARVVVVVVLLGSARVSDAMMGQPRLGGEHGGGFLYGLQRIPQKIAPEGVFYTTLLKEVDPRLVKWEAKTEIN
jgi:hypothetical protein